MLFRYWSPARVPHAGPFWILWDASRSTHGWVKHCSGVDVVCGSSVAVSQHVSFFLRTSLALWGFVTYVQLTSAALTHIYTHMSMCAGCTRCSLAHFSMRSMEVRGRGWVKGGCGLGRRGHQGWSTAMFFFSTCTHRQASALLLHQDWRAAVACTSLCVSACVCKPSIVFFHLFFEVGASPLSPHSPRAQLRTVRHVCHLLPSHKAAHYDRQRSLTQQWTPATVDELCRSCFPHPPPPPDSPFTPPQLHFKSLYRPFLILSSRHTFKKWLLKKRVQVQSEPELTLSLQGHV